MIRDIRQYWREVRALEASLPEFVWLTIVYDSAPAGFGKSAESMDRPDHDEVDSEDFASSTIVMEVTNGMAARLLQQKTHRHATEAEIAAHRQGEAAANRRARKEELRKQGRVQVLAPTSQEGPVARRLRS